MPSRLVPLQHFLDPLLVARRPPPLDSLGRFFLGRHIHCSFRVPLLLEMNHDRAIAFVHRQGARGSLLEQCRSKPKGSLAPAQSMDAESGFGTGPIKRCSGGLVLLDCFQQSELGLVSLEHPLGAGGIGGGRGTLHLVGGLGTPQAVLGRRRPRGTLGFMVDGPGSSQALLGGPCWAATTTIVVRRRRAIGGSATRKPIAVAARGLSLPVVVLGEPGRPTSASCARFAAMPRTFLPFFKT